VKKIISGGQTGADRAALDVAIELGIPHGGCVPLGRWAEDGPVADKYHLQECDSRLPAVRTELNVRHADATLIFSRGRLTGGSALTRQLARRCKKPMLHVDLHTMNRREARQRIEAWLREVRPGVLNVAGPRRSKDRYIYREVRAILLDLFRRPLAH
jgi:hypothetical protein